MPLGRRGWPTGVRAVLPLLALVLLVVSVGAPVARAGSSAHDSGGGGFRVYANASPTSGVAPLTVTFTGSDHGDTGKGVKFAWDFGDHGSGHGARSVHTYSDPGTYAVVLQGTDNGTGSTSSNSLTIAVAAASTGPGPGPSSPAVQGGLSLSTLGAPALVGPMASLIVALALVAVLVARRGRSPSNRPRRRGRTRTGRPAKLDKVKVEGKPWAPIPDPAFTDPKPLGPPSDPHSYADTIAQRVGESKEPSPGPMRTGIIWVRDTGGWWESSGKVPWPEATSEWQAKFREALGIREKDRVAVLPNGVDPNVVLVEEGPEDAGPLNLSLPRISR